MILLVLYQIWVVFFYLCIDKYLQILEKIGLTWELSQPLAYVTTVPMSHLNTKTFTYIKLTNILNIIYENKAATHVSKFKINISRLVHQLPSYHRFRTYILASQLCINQFSEAAEYKKKVQLWPTLLSKRRNFGIH